MRTCSHRVHCHLSRNRTRESTSEDGTIDTLLYGPTHRSLMGDAFGWMFNTLMGWLWFFSGLDDYAIQLRLQACEEEYGFLYEFVVGFIDHWRKLLFLWMFLSKLSKPQRHSVVSQNFQSLESKWKLQKRCNKIRISYYFYTVVLKTKRLGKEIFLPSGRVKVWYWKYVKCDFLKKVHFTLIHSGFVIQI